MLLVLKRAAKGGPPRKATVGDEPRVHPFQVKPDVGLKTARQFLDSHEPLFFWLTFWQPIKMVKGNQARMRASFREELRSKVAG
jgi:hypothetical protein